MQTVVGWMDGWVSGREDGRIYGNQIQNKTLAGHHIRLLSSPDSLLPSITRIRPAPKSSSLSISNITVILLRHVHYQRGKFLSKKVDPTL